MKFLFYLGHPAHFHLFKNVIGTLKERGHQVNVLIKKKDILEVLLENSGLSYVNILPEGRGDSRAGIAWGLLKRDYRLLRQIAAAGNRPDVMIGTSVEICHIGRMMGIPSISVNEDDAHVVPLFSKLAYPFASVILSPVACDNGKWEYKSVKYQGYQELAYLHPDHFTPDRKVVEKYFPADIPYFLLRFAKLTAHHDRGIRGIYPGLAEEILKILVPCGRVFITSERPVEPQFEPYRMAINPLDIHHVMALASLYIGDSQTMAAEAGMLGVPFIRYNDFVGRIGYLNELEIKYGLGYGFKPDEAQALLETLQRLAADSQQIKAEFQLKRHKMLSEKINTADFLVKFIEEFSVSRWTHR